MGKIVGHTTFGKPFASTLRHNATTHRRATIGEVPTMRCILSSTVVIHSLVAASKTDSLRMLALNVLRNQTNLSAALPLVVVAVDRLPIEGLANLMDILLEALVRKERGRLRRCRRRARIGASPHGNVGKELRHLERVALLLEELIIEGRVLRLLRLLFLRSGSQLRRGTLQGGALCASAKGGKVLRRLLAHAVDALPQASNLLPSRQALTELLLSQACKLAGSGGTLAKLLLANTHHLTGANLQGGAISLLSAKANPLLLLRRPQRLPVAGVVEVRDGLLIGKVLLIGEVGRRDARPIPAKGARPDGVAGKLRLLLLVLLVHRLHGRADHAVEVWRHILVDCALPQVGRVYGLRACRSKASGGLIVGLCGGLSAL